MYDRKIYKEIKPYIPTDDIIVIKGARQTGKTTLLKILMKDLPAEDTAYFDLEFSNLLDICNQGPDSVTAYLKQKGMLKNQEKFYLLIDEIQYLSEPSSFLKLIHDHYPYLKLIVSGSSSFEIKDKFKDSLVGRTVDFELYPLDFEEFLKFKCASFNLEIKITSPKLIDDLRQLYAEYVLYGGYPKIVLAESIAMKEKYLQQIIDTYVKKDIRDLARVKDITKFNKLLRVLASQSGQLLNVTELANSSRLAKQTIDEYLFILENTYIIKLLPPFHRNVRSELFKTPKIFFYDTGLLHMLWLKTLPPKILGNAFETSIFSEFVKNIGVNNLNYWRTQDKKEIDFIVNLENTIFPVEVKINAARMNFTPLKYFISKYKPENAFCISLEGTLPASACKVANVNPWEFSLFFPGL
ncbi:MAG: ATP-binding protein [Candidatus Aminicenantes bacterium]|nr:ATP-binding protein [Candidatus Aminicenantes bacterium]